MNQPQFFLFLQGRLTSIDANKIIFIELFKDSYQVAGLYHHSSIAFFGTEITSRTFHQGAQAIYNFIEAYKTCFETFYKHGRN